MKINVQSYAQIVTPACTLDCDCPPGSILLDGSQTSLSALISSGTLPSSPNPAIPLNIIVKTTLIFDLNPSGSNYQSYNFPEGSNICMVPDARLVINAGNAVTLNKAVVKAEGCNALWSDIAVQPGGKLTIKNYSTIQDGTLGVVVSPSSAFTSTNSTYNNNFISVRINPFTGSVGTPMNVDINSNTFTSTGSILSGNFTPSTGSLIPSLGHTPWAGIFSEHIGILILKGNNFQTLTNGIVTVGPSNSIILRNCSFKSMLNSSQNNGYGQVRGFGVYGKNGLRITVDGSGQNGPLAFENCRTGVYTESTLTTVVENCNMAAIQKSGIECRNQTFRATVLATKNTINSDLHGVVLYNLKSSGSTGSSQIKSGIHLSNNVITTGTDGLGISASEVSILPTNNISVGIAGNTINIPKGGTGINLQKSVGFNIKENIIDLQQAGAPSYGVRLEYCSDNKMDCNTITGMGASQTNHFGILATESQSNNFSCNPISGTGTGIQFYGNCDLSKVRGNELSNLGVGLRYANLGSSTNPVTAVTGVQKWKSNEWINGGASGAIHEGGQIVAITSQYFIQASIGTGNLWPTNPQPGAGWFSYLDPVINPDPNTPIFQCPTTNDCNITGFTDDGPCSDKAFRLTVANGQLSGGIYQEGWTWMKERYLYRNMKDECTDLLNQDPPFASFYNAVENPGPGTAKHVKAFYLADHHAELALVPSSNDAATMDGYQTQAESLSTSLEAVQEQIAVQGELPSLVQQRTALLLDLHNLSISTAALTGSISAARAQGIAAVATDNSAINTAMQVEINERTVNDIYFSTLALGNNNFNSTQLAQLQGIANQCPYAGGTAVFKARAMLGDDVSYNDKLLCQTDGRFIMMPNDGLQTSTFVAFSNPAQNIVQLSFGPRDAKGMLVVSDVFGRRVTTQQVPENTVSLALVTESWESGMYFLNLVFEGEKPSVQSIIISR